MSEGKKRVPRLRFPEFSTAGEWEKKNLGLFLVDCSGRVTSDTDLPVYSSARDGLKRQDAYFDGSVLRNNNDYGVVPADCFVYRHMSDDGVFKFNINRTGGSIAVSKEYPVFKTKDLNPRFLLAQLNDGLDFKSFAYSQKAGGTRTRLYFSKLCEWTTPLPSIPEQKRIADCLNSLDELIAAQSRKVEALISHKYGLMQQLFPREGETQPRTRFPEFRFVGKWYVGKLGNVAENLDNRRIPITSSDREIGAIPYYGASGIVDYVSDFIFDEELLCISEDGANLTARTYPIAFSISGKTWVNNHAHVLRFQNAYTQKFVEVYLNSIKLDNFITGIAQPKLNRSMLDSIPIPVPALVEQQRIADCLSSLESVVTAATQELATLKTHKKGLMQQLFPSVEALDA